jgi:hypothetical protein
LRGRTQQQHGSNTAAVATQQQHSSNTAATQQQHGSNTAAVATQQQHSSNTATRQQHMPFCLNLGFLCSESKTLLAV